MTAPLDDLRDIDTLRLHPAAEKVPLPDAADLRALRDSLRENGQEDPIDITPDGVILDGRTRWVLMRELGSITIRVRVIEMPSEQQVSYIIDRALARRHLTTRQKRALNDLMRVQVVEERPTKRGNVMRIGRSQTQRAAALGVDRDTVLEWDRTAPPLVAGNPATSDLPTHAIDARGRPQPIIHKPIHYPPKGSRPRPPLDITSVHNLNIANSAKGRLTRALSQMAGLCHGLGEVNYSYAVVAASPEEIAGWGVQITDIVRSLRAINAKIKEASK
jgi:ParB-like nuclease domain